MSRGNRKIFTYAFCKNGVLQIEPSENRQIDVLMWLKITDFQEPTREDPYVDRQIDVLVLLVKSDF
jgi:hypothetical protein